MSELYVENQLFLLLIFDSNIPYLEMEKCGAIEALLASEKNATETRRLAVIMDEDTCTTSRIYRSCYFGNLVFFSSNIIRELNLH